MEFHLDVKINNIIEGLERKKSVTHNYYLRSSTRFQIETERNEN